MKRILFVDDEKRVLDGLRRMLHIHRHEWDMAFALGGEAAQEMLRESEFDVIVSDMRMPGVDGARLLAWAQEHYPDMVRIVLSGYAEMEAALRAVPVAHQFLSKPCDPEQLKEVIDRACGLQSFMSSPPLREIVGRIDQLPTLPKVYHELTAKLANPECALKDVAGVVERDAGLTAKILQLVNSAFFGLPQRMTNVRVAVSYLGASMIKNVVLSLEVFRDVGEGMHSMVELQNHSLLTGSIARLLLDDKTQAEDAFAAGILHDVGKLVLATRMPDTFANIVEHSRKHGMSMNEAEVTLLGASHAEVGAFLLGLWGLPYPVVEAVAYHHQPRRAGELRMDVLAAVHIANALAWHAVSPETGGKLDDELIATLGVTSRLDGWKQMAKEHAGQRKESA